MSHTKIHRIMMDAMQEPLTMQDLGTVAMADLMGAAGITENWFSDLRIAVHKRCP